MYFVLSKNLISIIETFEGSISTKKALLSNQATFCIKRRYQFMGLRPEADGTGTEY
jgi:hypothetical protein